MRARLYGLGHLRGRRSAQKACPDARLRYEGGDEVFFKRKKRKSVTEIETPSATVCAVDAASPTYEKYVACMDKCRSELDEELKAYFIAAHNLKVSAKKISRIRGVYSNKLSKRKKKKHEIKICNYNDSLNSYANIASRVRWLLDTFASCADGAVAALKSKRAANKLRKRADEYSLKILKEKTRIEDITDGVVMPVSTYVN